PDCHFFRCIGSNCSLPDQSVLAQHCATKMDGLRVAVVMSVAADFSVLLNDAVLRLTCYLLRWCTRTRLIETIYYLFGLAWMPSPSQDLHSTRVPHRTTSANLSLVSAAHG